MNKKLILGVAALCTMGLSAGAWAADAATADEVVAKVKAAAADVKAGGDAALAAYNDPKGKWAWKDSYVFVMDCKTGVMSAHPNDKVKGTKLADLKGKAGENLGPALCAAAAKGANGGWVEYQWTKPGAEGNHRKVSYVLPAGNYAVGAGVYDDTPVAALEAKTK
ncbi:MAG: cache domain-containing protein [Candidatus Competibacter sp.]|nr:cache domain-containing protein [Candidatus Competibacter sp.]